MDKPVYKNASFSGESITLRNGLIKLVMFKRLSGWGFGELYDVENGKLMAVLDHLGELLVRDQELPMRLEAQGYVLEEDRIIFKVSTMVVQKKLDGTSFSNWMHYPFTNECIEGTVTIKLPENSHVLYVEHELKAKENMYVKYLRGPWLKVGAGAFGAHKDDAIFPGVEWLLNTEWASGSDWFREPWFSKFAPIVNKVSIPCIAVSEGGTGIGLSWNPNKWATRWFNYRKHFPQPVFAVPNFVDRMDNSLLGLMVPSSFSENDENNIFADPPLEVHFGEMFRFSSEISIIKGNSLDVIVDYVKRHGMPLPTVNDTKEFYINTLVRIAEAYNNNFWKDGEGFGNEQHKKYSAAVPRFLRKYIVENEGQPIADSLADKIRFCDDKNPRKIKYKERKTKLIKKGNEILGWQKEDGSFSFDPDGRHKSKDDFVVARDFAEPMGIAGDTALDVCVMPALDLLDIYGKTDEQVYLDAACKALDFCLPMTRPEGGDYWETPLHAPNLLAAGHGAIAFYEGYRHTNKEVYKTKAIYWIRSLLPFTHLWEPENIQMLYNTKPCLCSSDWYFANWVRDHVQWEVLQTFNSSISRGIVWAEIDKEIGWDIYHRGITTAVIRWMVDHTKDRWMPHNMPDTYEPYSKGLFDGTFPDTFNCTTGNYGGMVIMPDTIAENIYGVLERI
ncbi:MAG: hypothetical protein LBI03_02435 [Clostridiales bacterium]|jgi:hypothetical protein|nr:hypothetical protein [Clostridiales bacterium]